MDHSPGFLAHVEGRRPNVHEVSIADTLAALQANAAAVLIDVREDREWNAGHATQATHVARGVIERDIEKLIPDPATPLYLYCGVAFAPFCRPTPCSRWDTPTCTRSSAVGVDGRSRGRRSRCQGPTRRRHAVGTP